MVSPYVSGLVLSALMLTASAAGAEDAPQKAEDAPKKPAEWSYDQDATGQDQWGMLSPAYAKCEIGTEQSPIRIDFTEEKNLPPLEFKYERSIGYVVYRNHTVEVDIVGNNKLVEGGHEYNLKKIVMHSPSEHLVRSKYWLAELQFVHEDIAGKQLIVAIFVRIGDNNNVIHRLLARAPKKEGKSYELEFAPFALLPRNKGYYAYTGSLTIPPCTEGVEWRILKGTTFMSQEQLVQLTKYANRNARQKQPIYMRTVFESKQ